MTSAETAAILAVDRKVTDGLNLVHEQLGVIRQERLEDRREFREFRNEVRQEFKAVRDETKREFREVRGEIKGLREETRNDIQGLREGTRNDIQGLREGTRNDIQGLREETRNDIQGLREEFATVHARIDKLEGAIRELSTQLGTLLERSRGTRRLVWGVLGTLGLLAAGGVLRPVFDRVAAALLGG